MSCGMCPRACQALLPSQSYIRLILPCPYPILLLADESENSSLSGQVTPPESTTLSSSRTSSSSNFGENGTTEGVVNSLASPPLTAHSASQLRNACDAQPQPQPDGSDLLMSPDGSGVGTPDVVDAQIIEALKSKDRLFVLKLGEQMEALIKEQ